MTKIITQQNASETEDTNDNILIGDFETITLDVINNDVRPVTGRRTVLRLPSNTRINQNNRVLK